MGNDKSPFMDSPGREGLGRQGRQLDDRRRQPELSVEVRLQQEFSAAGNGDCRRRLSGQGWGEPRGRRQSHVHRWPKTVSRRVCPRGRSGPPPESAEEVNPTRNREYNRQVAKGATQQNMRLRG